MFWTAIIRDESMNIRDRLRASGLLGKSEGDFLDRVALGNDSENPDTIKVVLELVNGKSKKQAWGQGERAETPMRTGEGL